MPFPRKDDETGRPEERPITVAFSIPEVAALVDALLQAEMTLPLIDSRHGGMTRVDRLRDLQLSLAERLEDLLAEVRYAAPPREQTSDLPRSLRGSRP